MPYWKSSSKVGAVPQPDAPSSKKKKSERSSGRKAITIEDLKKQTALRLAKEQQAKESATAPRSSPSNSYRGVVPTYSPAKVASPAFAYPVQSPVVGQPLSVQQETRNSRDSGRRLNPKKKLPHGLTVQELKEMTKARLQAEHVDEPRQSPASSVPTLVQALPERPQPSPPGFRAAAPSPFEADVLRETWSQSDAWETASFGTAASEYQYIDEDSRSQRIHSPFLDQSAQNRRRAATMSPRLFQQDRVLSGIFASDDVVYSSMGMNRDRTLSDEPTLVTGLADVFRQPSVPLSWADSRTRASTWGEGDAGLEGLASMLNLDDDRY